jgi:hypothetical protein
MHKWGNAQVRRKNTQVGICASEHMHKWTNAQVKKCTSGLIIPLYLSYLYVLYVSHYERPVRLYHLCR